MTIKTKEVGKKIRKGINSIQESHQPYFPTYFKLAYVRKDCCQGKVNDLGVLLKFLSSIFCFLIYSV